MAVLLPSLLTQIDSYLMAYELKAHLRCNVVASLLREAITAPASQMLVDYERLELLGGTSYSSTSNIDAFLKVIATSAVLLEHPEKHEGILHVLRIKIVCNKFLKGCGNRHYLPSQLLTQTKVIRIHSFAALYSAKVAASWIQCRHQYRRNGTTAFGTSLRK